MDYEQLTREELLIEINKLKNKYDSLKLSLSKESELKKNLDESEFRFNQLVNNAPIGISVTSESGIIELANNSYCDLFGYNPEELLGKHFSIIGSESSLCNMIETHNKLIETGINYKVEWQVKKKNGTNFFILANGTRFIGKDGAYKRITFIIDFTKRMKIERELIERNKLLEEISKNDGLTELLNHNRIFLELEEQINICKENNNDLSILMLDLDHFKEINDVNGHLVGDEVLAMVGESIKKSIRDIDIAGRYGGEEFLIILPNTDLERAIVIAERIRTNISKLVFKGNLKVTTSGGIKQYKNESIFDFVKNADELLYKAKIRGRNRIEQ